MLGQNVYFGGGGIPVQFGQPQFGNGILVGNGFGFGIVQPQVRHTTIDVHGAGFRGQQTFVNGNSIGLYVQARNPVVESTNEQSISNGRVIRTIRWSDGTYEMFEGYHDNRGNFVSLRQTHSRF